MEQRTREEIMAEVQKGGMEIGSTSVRDNLALLVEVLTDIRDLLSKSGSKGEIDCDYETKEFRLFADDSIFKKAR